METVFERSFPTFIPFVLFKMMAIRNKNHHFTPKSLATFSHALSWIHGLAIKQLQYLTVTMGLGNIKEKC